MVKHELKVVLEKLVNLELVTVSTVLHRLLDDLNLSQTVVAPVDIHQGPVHRHQGHQDPARSSIASPNADASTSHDPLHQNLWKSLASRNCDLRGLLRPFPPSVAKVPLETLQIPVSKYSDMMAAAFGKLLRTRGDEAKRCSNRETPLSPSNSRCDQDMANSLADPVKREISLLAAYFR